MIEYDFTILINKKSNYIEISNIICTKENELLNISPKIDRYKLEELSSLTIFFWGRLYNANELIGTINEELYNQRVTEFILSKYQTDGCSFIDDLNGCFVVLILDPKEKVIYLMRDQSGLKSIYYYTDNSYVIVSSQLKLLLGNNFVTTKFSSELALKYYEEPKCFRSKTFYENILVPEGGEILKYNYFECVFKIDRYSAFLNSENIVSDRSIDSYIDEFWSLLFDSTKIRASHNSNNFILLSGGLDSSAIAKLTSRWGKTISLSMLSSTTYLSGDSQIAHNINKEINGKLLYFIHSYRNTKIKIQDWRKIISISEWPNINFRTLFRFYFNLYIYENFSQEDNCILTGLGCDQFFGGSARTSLINNKYDPSSINWETSYERLRKIYFEYTLEDNPYKLTEYYDFLSMSYINENSTFHDVNPWICKLKTKILTFFTGEVHQEEKLSKYFGNYSTFPFLDHRLLKFSSEIPSKYYKDLLWDKKIFRESCKKYLKVDIKFADKLKTGVYVNPNYSKSDNFFFDLFTNKRNYLKEELEELIVNSGIFDINKINHSIRVSAAKEDYKCFKILTPIMNVLLYNDEMSKGTDNTNDYSDYRPYTIEINDWNKEKTILEQHLDIHDLHNEKEIKIDLDMKVKFLENVILLYDESKKQYYISKNNQLLFIVEDDNTSWLLFLRKLSQKETVIRIFLDEKKIKFSDIEDYLVLSIQNKLITLE